MKLTTILIPALMVACMGACDRTSTTTNTTVQASQDVMEAKDFDLEQVIGLVSSGKSSSTEELEKTINDPSTGINNVDIDHDGNVDWISVKESVDNAATSLEFLASPSGDKAKEPVVIASVKLSKNTTTNTVDVSGGYPEYVGGYNDHYYHHGGLTLGDALFLSYLMRPHAVYVPMYHPPMYVPRARLGYGVIDSTRTTVRQTTKFAPVQKTARPSTYTSPSVRADTASKVRSQFAPPPVAGGSIRSNGGAMKDYSVRPNTNSRPTGGSFGGSRPSVTPSRPSFSPSRPSTPSRPSFSPSRGGRR